MRPFTEGIGIVATNSRAGLPAPCASDKAPARRSKPVSFSDMPVNSMCESPPCRPDGAFPNSRIFRNRKRPRQSEPKLMDGFGAGLAGPEPEIERQAIAHLPDRAYEPRVDAGRA